MKYATVPNVISGAPSTGAVDLPSIEVFNPSDGTVISRVPLSGHREVDLAVQAARKAFPAWSATPIKERVQVFYRYKALLEQNIAELAALVHRGERQS